MTNVLTVKRTLTIAALTLAWCGLWGSVSVANVASGIVIAAAVTASGVGTRCRGGILVVPLLRLIGLVAVDLVRSTAGVAREILTRTDHTEESIIAVEVSPHSRDHFLLLIIAVTLTPGTAVVDADPDSGTLYLHLLHHGRHRATTAHVKRLADLATQALPGPTLRAST